MFFGGVVRLFKLVRISSCWLAVASVGAEFVGRVCMLEIGRERERMVGRRSYIML